MGGEEIVGAWDAVGGVVGDWAGDDVGSSGVTVGGAVVTTGANDKGAIVGRGATVRTRSVDSSASGDDEGLPVGNDSTGQGSSCTRPYIESGLHGSLS